MANEYNSREDSIWPLPKFRFEVDLGNDMKKVSFQEVSGLDTENQTVDYGISKTKMISNVKMPGISNYGNVTMKRGVFVKDNSFWNWHKEIAMNTIKRRTVIIQLLDENGNVTMKWTLSNAWPTKITSTDLKSDGNEIAVETLEIAYEQLKIFNEKE